MEHLCSRFGEYHSYNTAQSFISIVDEKNDKKIKGR